MVWELKFSHHTLWFALEACCEPEKCIVIRANMCLGRTFCGRKVQCIFRNVLCFLFFKATCWEKTRGGKNNDFFRSSRDPFLVVRARHCLGQISWRPFSHQLGSLPQVVVVQYGNPGPKMPRSSRFRNYRKKLPKLHYILDIVGYTLLGRSSQFDHTHRSGQLPGLGLIIIMCPRHAHRSKINWATSA